MISRLKAGLYGGALLLAGAVAASSATAQEPAGGDWDLHRDRDGVLAYTTYDSGLAIAFRCRQGAFAAVAAGLPSSREARRSLVLRFEDDDEPQPSMWTTTTNDTVAVADYPAPLARKFRRGGPLRLTIPGGASDGRDLTHVVELPPSNVAIDTALSECGRPLVDPRDALLEAVEGEGLSGGATWARAPRVDFPSTRYAAGFVVLSCLAWMDGRLTDCIVESEHPHDGRFGEAALRGARRARVALPEGSPPGPFRVGFYVNFRSAP